MADMERLCTITYPHTVLAFKLSVPSGFVHSLDLKFLAADGTAVQTFIINLPVHEPNPQFLNLDIVSEEPKCHPAPLRSERPIRHHSPHAPRRAPYPLPTIMEEQEHAAEAPAGGSLSPATPPAPRPKNGRCLHEAKAPKRREKNRAYHIVDKGVVIPPLRTSPIPCPDLGQQSAPETHEVPDEQLMEVVYEDPSPHV